MIVKKRLKEKKMNTLVTIVVTVLLLLLWRTVGELGFCIWRAKVLEAKEPKNVNILARKNKFVLAGPAGLIYALNYKG
jgi:nitrate reductase NapE component